METKRVFFGVEGHAAWPDQLPLGRLIPEESRHLTLAFLGNQPLSRLQAILARIPPPPFQVALSGYFDKCLFFPPGHPHVAAWRLQLYEEGRLKEYQALLASWLAEQGYPIEERKWVPHMTLCRTPFDPHAWKKNFTPLPGYCGSLHLYESRGNLTYFPLWSSPLLSPFEEIEHQADLAFLIRGSTVQQLYLNAFTALAFKTPALLSFFEQTEVLSLDDIVIALNERIAAADCAEGTPFKAVSFHGEIYQIGNEILEWEMIVDV
jgi:2'-5' RNA ligase